jgi:predicted acylesterase/phospholipase RssA/CRP-like cAMP-binding protein
MTPPDPDAGPLRSIAPTSPGLLDDPALAGVVADLSTVHLRAGDTLFTAGDPGDALYVVVYGRLRAVLPDENADGGERLLGEIGRGESVGEMALLTGEPRSATVRAVRDTELLQLSQQAFHALAERQPRLMLEMARLIVSRYQRMIRPGAQARPVTIALVPCHASVPIGEVAANVERELADGHRVLVLDSARVQQARGAPIDRLAEDIETSAFAGWLQEQELRHEYILYVAEAVPSPWTLLCARQADLVLLVGESTGATRIRGDLLNTVVRGDDAATARRELVLLSDRRIEEATGASDWLARVPVRAHHHVQPGQRADYARLVRLITGRGHGLVLGGGGARGLAHIGVIRAFEEARIPIDYVGGTSAGGIVGAQFACGRDSARIQADSRRVLVESGSLNDYTLPLFALIRGNRYLRMLQRLFGERHIEDLPLPFFCVSTNLTLSSGVVHQRGLLWRRVAASCAVPGLGPPIIDGAHLLVDGGVVNNLPADVMRGLGLGRVFASSVSPRAGLEMTTGFTIFPSPWRLLFNRMNPFGKPLHVPGIKNILMRSASLQQGSTEEAADLVIIPAGSDWGLLDWSSFDHIVERGYRAAAKAIEDWQARDATAALVTEQADAALLRRSG